MHAGQGRLAARLPVGCLVVRLPDDGNRVDSLAILQDFEMQIGPGGTSRFTHQGDSLPLAHFFANRDQVLSIVCIPG